MAINKVIFGNDTLIDLSSDTVTIGKLANGYKAHTSSGVQITGTMQTVGEDGLTWNEASSSTWGVIDRIPHTSQEKSVSPSVSEQIIVPDNAYDYLSKVTVGAAALQAKNTAPNSETQVITPDANYYGLSQVRVSPAALQVKTVTPNSEAQTVTPDAGYYGLSQVNVSGASSSEVVVLTKTLSYSTAKTTSTLIWSSSDLEHYWSTSFTDYEYLSMCLIKTDYSSHTTNQLTYCNSFYPYASYKATSGYVYSGINWYHSTSTTSVVSGKSSTALNGSVAGFFQVKSDGIYIGATTSYALKGTYLFIITAKLAS